MGILHMKITRLEGSGIAVAMVLTGFFGVPSFAAAAGGAGPTLSAADRAVTSNSSMSAVMTLSNDLFGAKGNFLSSATYKPIAHALFNSLNPGAQRVLVDDILTPVREVVTTESATPPSTTHPTPGDPCGEVDSAQATEYDYGGVVIVQWSQWINWCWNGSSVTSIQGQGKTFEQENFGWGNPVLESYYAAYVGSADYRLDRDYQFSWGTLWWTQYLTSYINEDAHANGTATWTWQ